LRSLEELVSLHRYAKAAEPYVQIMLLWCSRALRRIRYRDALARIGSRLEHAQLFSLRLVLASGFVRTAPPHFAHHIADRLQQLLNVLGLELANRTDPEAGLAAEFTGINHEAEIAQS
jgi:hypothetical protein